MLMESVRHNRTKLFHVLYQYSNININRIDAVMPSRLAQA